MDALRINKGVVEKSLRSLAPMLDHMLAIVARNGGRTHLPQGLFQRLKTLGIERWAEFYLDQRKLVLTSLLGVYSSKQLEEIGRTLSSSSEEEQQKFWESLIDYLSTDNWMDEVVEDYLHGMTPEDMVKELESIFQVADGEFRSELALTLQSSLLNITVSFHNSMAMMAYGAPMSQWVSRAATGDMKAYYKAFHVDPTVAEVPCFAALHEEKKRELKGSFFTALSLRRRSPLIPERLKHPKLMFTFAYLDSFGLLPSRDGDGFSLKHLLDVCVDLKIYGANYDKGVDDLGHRLQDYRKLQTKLMARAFT